MDLKEAKHERTDEKENESNDNRQRWLMIKKLSLSSLILSIIVVCLQMLCICILIPFVSVLRRFGDWALWVIWLSALVSIFCLFMIPSLVLTAIIFRRLRNDIDWAIINKVRVFVCHDAISHIDGDHFSSFEK